MLDSLIVAWHTLLSSGKVEASDILLCSSKGFDCKERIITRLLVTENVTLYDMVLAFLPSSTIDSLDPFRLLLELLKDIVEIFFCF